MPHSTAGCQAPLPTQSLGDPDSSSSAILELYRLGKTSSSEAAAGKERSEYIPAIKRVGLETSHLATGQTDHVTPRSCKEAERRNLSYVREPKSIGGQ